MAEPKTTTTAPPAPHPPKAPEQSHTYEVQIAGNKPLTIQAVSEGDALQQYKRQMGIIASAHEATVTRTA